jgi:ABC-2 type transport system permease protein
MKKLLRYLKVFIKLASRSIQKDLAYRFNFLSNLISSLGWINFSLITILVFNSQTDGFGGWDSTAMLLITGSWMINNGSAYFFFYSNMKKLVRDVHNGDLDLFVLKPIDSQFLVSFRQVLLNALVGPLEGIVVIIYALIEMNESPNLEEIAMFGILIICSILIYYSFWFFAASLTIHFTLAENLFYLVPEAVQFSKFPADAYPKPLFYLLQTLIPIALMTTFPARALLGNFSWEIVVFTIMLSIAIFLSVRRFWFWSLKKYTGAGG